MVDQHLTYDELMELDPEEILQLQVRIYGRDTIRKFMYASAPKYERLLDLAADKGCLTLTLWRFLEVLDADSKNEGILQSLPERI